MLINLHKQATTTPKVRASIQCAFRGNWALISRDLGHAFHAIIGSNFTLVGRLADAFMESGWSGLVKRFHDRPTSSEAFA